MKLHIVPARQGFQWVKLGIQTFFRQPMAMAGQFFLFMAVMSVLGMVPVLGPLVAIVLIPAATVGLMAASREASEGRFPMPGQLISAFRAGAGPARSILVLGGMYAAGFALVLSSTALVDGGKFMQVYLGNAALTEELVTDNSFMVASLMFTALYLPLNLLFWHAPALVLWHGVAPVKSLFFSLVACFRNFWALTLYSLTWTLVALALFLLIASVAAMIGGPQAIPAMLYPMGLLIAAMFFTSIYFTFRDSFDLGAEAQP
ncbi:MAG: BPSS1780 family membrane protein [Rhodoferax sp.]